MSEDGSSSVESNVQIKICTCANQAKHDSTCFMTFILNISSKMESHTAQHAETALKLTEHSAKIDDLEVSQKSTKTKVKDLDDFQAGEIKR